MGEVFVEDDQVGATIFMLELPDNKLRGIRIRKDQIRWFSRWRFSFIKMVGSLKAELEEGWAPRIQNAIHSLDLVPRFRFGTIDINRPKPV